MIQECTECSKPFDLGKGPR